MHGLRSGRRRDGAVDGPRGKGDVLALAKWLRVMRWETDAAGEHGGSVVGWWVRSVGAF